VPTQLTRALILVALLAVAGGARAVLTIKITGGTEGAAPVAVVPFAWAGGGSPPGVAVGEVVADDLRRSGRFAPIPVADLPARPSDGAQVDFRDWRLLGVEHLVIGRVAPGEGERLTVEFQLFDVFKGSRLTGYSIPTSPRRLRRTAHRVSDIVYEELTGERGAFATWIAYVTELPEAGEGPRYALQVADSDGRNPETVLESGQPILSPAWSPDAARLAYVSFEGGAPAVYVQDVATGSRQRVAAHPGLNSAPAFSPDGKRLALTLSKDGNPEIYLLELATGALTRLTDNGAIDTEPAFSPDGRHLVFTSDRGGAPQIYRIPVTGGRPERLTFEGGYNASARYAPDGERLAMVHRTRRGYHVAVLDLETRALRVLTDGRLDESPSFAPNGAMLIYATEDIQGSALAAVAVDGSVRQRLTARRGQVREPAWSPFLD
jgi:TolB protein